MLIGGSEEEKLKFKWLLTFISLDWFKVKFESNQFN